MYGLYAVLVHSGYSCNAGHYYCYVKVSPGHSGLGAAGSGCAALQEALLQSPLACTGVLWALARGALLVGAVPAGLRARRGPGHSPTPFSLLLWQASNGQWFQMNDSVVSLSNIKTVLNQEAYLLFYVRWECL